MKRTLNQLLTKKLLLSISLLLLLCSVAEAQFRRTIKGVIADSTGVLPSVSVRITSASDTLGTATNINGEFTFPAVKAGKFRLTATSIGYQIFSREYSVDKQGSVVTLPRITLADAFNELQEVVIVAITPVRVKEDTVQYDARAYQVREGDAVEEMVKKLPGLEVSKDGSVTAQGQAVTRIRLNGKDFFGDDARAALQNLPADIVQNLQVIDDYGEQAKLTGVKTEEPQKVLNINTKPDKRKGYFGRMEGGLGTEDRYAGRFRASRFNGDQQLSFDGTLNNITGGAGTTDAGALKFNYRDKWGEKLSSYGSYRFNASNNSTLENVLSQNIYSEYTRFDDASNNTRRFDNDHRLSWNFEYEIDKNNYLKVEPEISYNPSRSNNTGATFTRLLASSSSRENISSNSSLSSQLGAEIFFNHKFSKPGRNFSVRSDLNRSDGSQDREVTNDYLFTDSLDNITSEYQHQVTNSDNINSRTRFELSYMEPISKTSFLELSYGWNRSHTESVRNTRDVDPVSGLETVNKNLSNDYNYQFTTNTVEMNYRQQQNHFNYVIGLSAQPALLEGQDVSRNLYTSKRTFNWIPVARFAYKFSKKSSLVARYFGRNSQPGFSQLQPITDNSNLQNVVTGNPDLKPEFSHNMGLEYRQSDWSSGYTMFGNLSFNQTQNKIVSARVIDPDSLKQYTSFINTDGFYTARGNYAFSRPFNERKYVLTYYGAGNYSNNIAFTNNERNIGKNFVLTQGFKFRFDLADIINTEINTSYSFNTTNYSAPGFNERKLHTYYIGLEGRNYFFKDLTLGYDFSQTINQGYNSGNPNPTILSLYLEHRFLKGNKGSIRLQGNDLLNQNTGISRDVFDNEIVDRRNNRLARYFLLSFNYRLQQFGR
ncbi:TonB-dependent receptor [Pedobacter sp. SYSU D00535]|uniref:TonB-dependent receptor n=1 Tax=Pedobacter sp. SYSU D00535 TaxID=2810308 RepID=UPI001A95A25E|nr:TonB-dependent receptor [Pedobacter sp. SYSU D00535]